MDPVKLNLATFNYYDKKVATVALVMIIFFLGGLSLYSVTRAVQGKREIVIYENKIKRLEKSLAKSKKAREKVREKLKGEEMRAIREGTAFVNRIIAKNVFPFDRLLDGIETSIPTGMVLESLMVAEDFHTISMKGVAESSAEIDLLLGRLKKSGLFERNLLTKLSVKELGKNGDAQAGTQGMRFEIESKLSIDELFSAKGYEGRVKIIEKALSSARHS